MGRVATFVIELAEADAPAVEARIEELCVAFEERKDRLRRAWDGEGA
jgi:hypothetical protein